jgi:hypothetical protein
MDTLFGLRIDALFATPLLASGWRLEEYGRVGISPRRQLTIIEQVAYLDRGRPQDWGNDGRQPEASRPCAYPFVAAGRR